MPKGEQDSKISSASERYAGYFALPTVVAAREIIRNLTNSGDDLGWNGVTSSTEYSPYVSHYDLNLPAMNITSAQPLTPEVIEDMQKIEALLGTPFVAYSMDCAQTLVALEIILLSPILVTDKPRSIFLHPQFAEQIRQFDAALNVIRDQAGLVKDAYALDTRLDIEKEYKLHDRGNGVYHVYKQANIALSIRNLTA